MFEKIKKNRLITAVIVAVDIHNTKNKCVVSGKMSHNDAQQKRRELMQNEEHFDMFGEPSCLFRLKKIK